MKKVDENKAMVVSQTKEVKHHADELSKVLGKHKNIESWVVGKIERASTDLSDVTHYLDGKKYAKGGDVGIEYVLWGVKIGEPSWAEDILFVDKEEIKLNKSLKDFFKSKGYDRLRIAKIDLSEKPNFFENGGELNNNCEYTIGGL